MNEQTIVTRYRDWLTLMPRVPDSLFTFTNWLNNSEFSSVDVVESMGVEKFYDTHIRQAEE